MKAVNTGLIYRIYGDDVQTYDALPAQSYTVQFSPDNGFYLEKHAPIEIKEPKIYGIHEQKVSKVLNNFRNSMNNLGVILSGDKGIGKSLFSKLLSIRAIESGYPLIIVETYHPGIAHFLESIEQEVVVLFDEFDKTFYKARSSEEESTAQSSLLSLFDGLAQGKKLFIITCNELRSLSEYLINRPGRFLYHFRFKYPETEEIRAYLKDKLNPQYTAEIEKVISFSHKVNLNYDCLRAIVLELNTGEPFEDAIQDLNILNISENEYDLSLYFKDGTVFQRTNYALNLFTGNAIEDIYLKNIARPSEGFYILLNPKDCVFKQELGAYIISSEHLSIQEDEYDDDSTKLCEKLRNIGISHLVITRSLPKDLHYVC